MPEFLLVLIGLLLGAALGAAIGIYYARGKAAEDSAASAQQIARLEGQIESDARAFAKREDLIRANSEEAQERIKADHAALREQFEALASEALARNNQRFLDVAEERFKRSQSDSVAELDKREQMFRSLVEPMKETLNKVEAQTTEAEKLRIQTQESLSQQIRHMIERSDELGKTTESLRSALRRPEVRGRWGELHLRRVVELAGLQNGVDFTEQSSETTEEGNRLRPDMIVTLSGGRKIIVDAKAPLDAILDIDTDPENAEMHAERHVRNVRKRVRELSEKRYREQFGSALDFSVLFLPAESFLQVATERDPKILTDAYEAGVIIATPTVLVAMLRTVAHTWKAETLAENAQQVLDSGKELYKRFSTMGGHLARLGKAIDSASDNYNKTIGSLERQVLPEARRFAELQRIEQPIEVNPVEKTAREITAPELLMPELPDTEAAELESGTATAD